VTRKYKQEARSGSNILLVDDNLEYLEATRMLLQREGHIIATAHSGADALDIVKKISFDLILVDYYMPNMTGEEFIRELRTFNRVVQIILQTGYASEHPPRELLRKLDIQGYFDKSEGPHKLLLWVDVGIKAAKTMRIVNRSRECLDYVLHVIPDLHEKIPLYELLTGILIHITGHLRAENSFLATFSDNLSTDLTPQPGAENNPYRNIPDNLDELIIRMGTGRCAGKKLVTECLDRDELDMMTRVLTSGTAESGGGFTILPLRAADSVIGAIYIDTEISASHDPDILNIFANQAAIALYRAAVR
jgi:two-component system cell cycle response regulator